MTAPPLTPPELATQPWWPRAASMSMSDVLDLLGAIDPLAASLLGADILCRLAPAKFTGAGIDRFFRDLVLRRWVETWTPPPPSPQPPPLAAPSRRRAPRPPLTTLHDCPALLAQALAKHFAPRPPDELSPIGDMDARILFERLSRNPGEHPRDTSLPGWASSQTLRAYLTSPWGRSPALRRWFESLARGLRDTLADEAAARQQRLERWQSAAHNDVTRELLEIHGRWSQCEVPIDDALRARVALTWSPADDRLTATANGLLACLSGTCTSVTLELDPNVPVVSCARDSGPCRLKLAALEATLDALTGEDAAHAALRQYLARPAWSRALARLETVGGAFRSNVARLGWILRSPTEIEPVRLAPKKGGGLKAARISDRDMETTALDNGRDRLAWSLLERPRYGLGPNIERVAQALSVLVGADNVYVRDGELVPLTIRVDEPRVELLAGPEGERLVVRLGDRVIDDHPRAGTWTIDLDVPARVAHLGYWSSAAFAVWKALHRASAAIIPNEATSEVASALLALPPVIPVKTDERWLGTPIAPAPDLVFRLAIEGSRGARHLLLAVCVHPVPELGPSLPGEGDEVIPLRRDGEVHHVRRDFDDERRRAAAAAIELGLPPEPTATSTFNWTIPGLGEALATWRRITDVLAARAPHDEPWRLEWRTRAPQVRVAAQADRLRVKVGMRRDWLDLSGGFELDGGELPLAALLQALRDQKRFIELDDDRIVEVDAVLAQQLAPLVAIAQGRGDEGGPLRASPLAAPLLAEIEGAGAIVDGPPEWLGASRRLHEAADLQVDVPTGLVASLRPYQRDGLTWLARLAHWAKGACLADEMGLGKTLQALALLLRRAPLGRALVIAPTSVVPNWRREAARFAPGLDVAMIARGTDIGALDSPASLVLTSWDLLVRHEARFVAPRWATVVLDEAHAMKNSVTRRAQSARALDADFVLALTGTPVENRPAELWSLFQVVAPGLLGSAESFRNGFGRAIEGGDREAVRRLARLARPFLLRRRKDQVATDLPPLTDVRVDVVLSSEERARYERVRRSALAELQNVDDDRTPGAAGRRMLRILVVLTRLRQLACHPRLVDPKAPPSSVKLERLLELAQELRDEGRKMLVFSQFTELLALVRTAFDAAGITYTYLDGATPQAARVAAIDRFQVGAVDAFLLSLKAGGVGLNLTTASEVIHLDPWWNPAVEDQATGRAHRIGQDKPVTVYRLVTQGTIEEQIVGLHGDKRTMVANLLEGTGAATTLTADELMALLSEEGLEASAPDGEPESTAKSSPESTAKSSPESTAKSSPESTAKSTLPRALELLASAPGAMRRAEIVAAVGIDEPAWQELRAQLERDPRVEVTGQARGRTYRWRHPPATPA